MENCSMSYCNLVDCPPLESSELGIPAHNPQKNPPHRHLQQPVHCHQQTDVLCRQAHSCENEEHGDQPGAGNAGCTNARQSCCKAAKTEKPRSQKGRVLAILEILKTKQNKQNTATKIPFFFSLGNKKNMKYPGTEVNSDGRL